MNNQHIHPLFGSLFDRMYQPAAESADAAVQASYDAAAQNARAADCDHDWHIVRDCEGDPGVINGTHSFMYLECRRCGAESWDECAIEDALTALAAEDFDWDIEP